VNSIYRYLANPDSVYQLNSIQNSTGNNPLSSIFSESVTIKELISGIVQMSKSKVKESFKIIKQSKGIIQSIKKSDNRSFSVELDDGNFAKLALKRKKIREFRKKACQDSQNSQVTAWSSVNYNNQPFNMYQSIKYALNQGSFQKDPFKVVVKDEHLRYPLYRLKQNYNMMMVLDVSNSVQWIMPYMEKIVAMITRQAKISKDKLGLITFKNDTANIRHYPTNNIHHIIGSINDTVPSGLTPLADGIRTATQILDNSRYKTIGMANAIILVSDCFPEPITGKYPDLMEEPVCKDFILACKKLPEKNIRLLIINPVLSNNKHYEKSLGYKLGSLAAEEAKGQFVNITGKVWFTAMSNEASFALDPNTLNSISRQLDDFSTGLI